MTISIVQEHVPRPNDGQATAERRPGDIEEVGAI
jgi:hypothetical protein